MSAHYKPRKRNTCKKWEWIRVYWPLILCRSKLIGKSVLYELQVYYVIFKNANVRKKNKYCIFTHMCGIWASLVAHTVKILPPVQETWVHSLGWQDPLERGMATHSGILAWRIPWTEEPGGLYTSWDLKESGMPEQLTHTHT